MQVWNMLRSSLQTKSAIYFQYSSTTFFAIAIILSLTISQNTCPCFWQSIQRIFPNSKPPLSASFLHLLSAKDGHGNPTSRHANLVSIHSPSTQTPMHAWCMQPYINEICDHQCPTTVTPRMSTCPREKEGRHAKHVYVAHVLSC